MEEILLSYSRGFGPFLSAFCMFVRPQLWAYVRSKWQFEHEPDNIADPALRPQTSTLGM